ncbi:N-acetylglucosaminyl-phosphatidylinositol de-N-acetylase [Trichinella patagoniensis]|uniref:N-acetylglucosaminylphosphatidylinositol deacetylase n=1 Tax=Trichinella patagoniensis TaxID=990121 RepID=A0A0V0ZE43_9BILA|nr:N-acetylglucosaminyl-phosphatidylinositol de-N-acetylase [Trichinella patagoniensis]
MELEGQKLLTFLFVVFALIVAMAMVNWFHQLDGANLVNPNIVHKLFGKTILFIIAHPDDECMFFGPTLITLAKLQCRVHILCLSSGNYRNNGSMYTVCSEEFSCFVFLFPMLFFCSFSFALLQPNIVDFSFPAVKRNCERLVERWACGTIAFTWWSIPICRIIRPSSGIRLVCVVLLGIFWNSSTSKWCSRSTTTASVAI